MRNGLTVHKVWELFQEWNFKRSHILNAATLQQYQSFIGTLVTHRDKDTGVRVP